MIILCLSFGRHVKCDRRDFAAHQSPPQSPVAGAKRISDQISSACRHTYATDMPATNFTSNKAHLHLDASNTTLN